MLERLSDGGLHSTVELNVMGVGRPNSRSSELQERHGYRIECVYVKGAEGAQAYQYRLLTVPPLAPAIEAEWLSPEARARIEVFRGSPVLEPPAGTTSEPSPLEQLELADLAVVEQLQLDELAAVESEVGAIGSVGPPFAPEELDRFDVVEGHRDELEREEMLR